MHSHILRLQTVQESEATARDLFQQAGTQAEKMSGSFLLELNFTIVFCRFPWNEFFLSRGFMGNVVNHSEMYMISQKFGACEAMDTKQRVPANPLSM